MKKNIILLFVVVFTQYIVAQDSNSQDSLISKKKNIWFDLHIGQHFGLNSWSSTNYVNEGYYKASITEFKGILNLYFINSYFGGFIDMGMGILPAPKMKTLDLDKMPMPHKGTKYYQREILSESGNEKASVNFTMSFGLMGNIEIDDNMSIMPYLGIGYISMPQRTHEILLKEDGSNMQYNTIYIWNGIDDYQQTEPLTFIYGKLLLKNKFLHKTNFLLGLEYRWFFDTIDFYGKYTNTFNLNNKRDFRIKGNQMNMIGVIAGISF